MTITQRDRDLGTGHAMKPSTTRPGLTSVGRGTPIGELLRRYWHPIGLAADAVDIPRKVRALGRVESIGWTLPIDDTSFRIYVAGRVKNSGDIGRMRSRFNGKFCWDMTEQEHQQFPGDYEAQVGAGGIRGEEFHSRGIRRPAPISSGHLTQRYTRTFPVVFIVVSIPPWFGAAGDYCRLCAFHHGVRQ